MWRPAALVSLGLVFVAQGFVRATPPVQPNWELQLPDPAASTADLTGSTPLSRLAAHGDNASRPVLPNGDAPPPDAPKVLIFGDSVTLGAKNYLRHGHEEHVELDSEIGRTSSTALPRLRKLKRTHKLPPVVVLHLGNNGWVYEEQVHEMMSLLAEVERVVVVNAHVPKPWQDRNNATIRSVLSQYPRVILIDWLKASEGHRDWFGGDGLHLTPRGADAFAQLILPHYTR
jgi:hypothetical protein